MDILIKAAVAGALSALLTLVIKKSNPEMALVLALSASALIIVFAAQLIGSVRGFIGAAAEVAGLTPAVVAPVLKCVGIGVITKLCSDLCSDAGAGVIASSVDLAGAAAALYIALPLLQTLLKMVGDLL